MGHPLREVCIGSAAFLVRLTFSCICVFSPFCSRYTYLSNSCCAFEVQYKHPFITSCKIACSPLKAQRVLCVGGKKEGKFPLLYLSGSCHVYFTVQSQEPSSLAEFLKGTFLWWQRANVLLPLFAFFQPPSPLV